MRTSTGCTETGRKGLLESTVRMSTGSTKLLELTGRTSALELTGRTSALELTGCSGLSELTGHMILLTLTERGSLRALNP